MTKVHNPVMLDEALSFLNLKPGMVVVDTTVGAGGHAEKILEKIIPSGRLIGIDRDKESLESIKLRLENYNSNMSLVHDNFMNIDKIVANLKVKKVDAVFFDLGISSIQLDTPDRGFSIKYEGPLDMRMDRGSYISAYDLVNNLTKEELSLIIKNFGQERWHNRIARFIINAREKNPITTTTQLSKIILNAVPYRKEYWRIHPATRTFQALRIAVNRELEALEEGLVKSIDILNNNGRLVVISFHSLEDRAVKHTFRSYAHKSKIRILTKKPLKASVQEIAQNPRSRSACLRAAEIIGEI